MFLSLSDCIRRLKLKQTSDKSAVQCSLCRAHLRVSIRLRQLARDRGCPGNQARSPNDLPLSDCLIREEHLKYQPVVLKLERAIDDDA